MKNDPFQFAANRPALDYRWRCGLRASRWFKSRQAAENAAVRGGMAIREGTLFLPGPLLEIESRPAETKKKGAGSLRRPSFTHPAKLNS